MSDNVSETRFLVRVCNSVFNERVCRCLLVVIARRIQLPVGLDPRTIKAAADSSSNTRVVINIKPGSWSPELHLGLSLIMFQWEISSAALSYFFDYPG